MRNKLLDLALKLVDELSREDFEGSTVRELVADLNRAITEIDEDTPEEPTPEDGHPFEPSTDFADCCRLCGEPESAHEVKQS